MCDLFIRSKIEIRCQYTTNLHTQTLFPRYEHLFLDIFMIITLTAPGEVRSTGGLVKRQAHPQKMHKRTLIH